MNTGATSIIKALDLNSRMSGSSPVVRKIILEKFLWARQNTAERVVVTVANVNVNVTTYFMYDKETNLICEDVVVESRPSIG